MSVLRPVAAGAGAGEVRGLWVGAVSTDPEEDFFAGVGAEPLRMVHAAGCAFERGGHCSPACRLRTAHEADIEQEPLLATLLLYAGGLVARAGRSCWEGVKAWCVPDDVQLGTLTNDDIDSLGESGEDGTG